MLCDFDPPFPPLFELPIVPMDPPSIFVVPAVISAMFETFDVISANAVNELIIPSVVYTVPCVILIAVGKPTRTEHGLVLPSDEYTSFAHASKVPLLKSLGWNVFICP